MCVIFFFFPKLGALRDRYTPVRLMDNLLDNILEFRLGYDAST